MFYSGIMDMLSQQHPEYVALAWGAMKFLLVVRAALEYPAQSKAGQKLTIPPLGCH